MKKRQIIEEKKRDRELQIEEELQRLNTLQKTKEKALERNRKRREFNADQRKKKNKSHEEEMSNLMQKRASLLLDEPTMEKVQKKQAIQLRFRLPNGDHVSRNFYTSDKLETVFAFVETKYPFLINNSYVVLSYPRVLHSDPELDLATCNINQSMSLVVELE